jgi:hypothetical protein
MAALWRPSSSDLIALWKKRKIRIGDFKAELFRQVLDGVEGSIGFNGPAITATPPAPPLSIPENGVAIIAANQLIRKKS